MIWWVTVKGRNVDRDVELFYVVEARDEDTALVMAADRLGVRILDEVYDVNAVRSA